MTTTAYGNRRREQRQQIKDAEEALKVATMKYIAAHEALTTATAPTDEEYVATISTHRAMMEAGRRLRDACAGY